MKPANFNERIDKILPDVSQEEKHVIFKTLGMKSLECKRVSPMCFKLS